MQKICCLTFYTDEVNLYVYQFILTKSIFILLLGDKCE